MKTININIPVQCLKGVACLMVFFSHSLNAIKSETITTLNNTPFHFLYDGQCAVVLFFVISGFFYYTTKPFTVSDYFRKIIRKVKKIYPAYILSILIAFLLCNLLINYDNTHFTDWFNSFWNDRVTIVELLKQIPIIIPGFNPDILNPPVWYLLMETRMCIIMPLFVGFFMWLSKFMGAKVKELALLLILISFSYFLFNGAICFTIGYLFRWVYENWKIILKKSQTISKINIFFWLLGVLLLNIQNEITLASLQLNYMIQAVGASIILVLTYSCSLKITVKNILTSIGNISYEIYLFHFVILLSLRPITSDFSCFVVSSLSLTLIVAIIVHKFVSLK